MTESEIAELTAKASRLNRSETEERDIKLSWRSRSNDLERLAHTGEPVGVAVFLTITHDKKRKQYDARLAKWHTTKTENGVGALIMSPLDRNNYPSTTIATEPATRYSAVKMSKFAEQVLANLAKTAETNTTAAMLLELAKTIA